MYKWLVTKYVKEFYEVYADTKEEARRDTQNVIDPFDITIVATTVQRVKDSEKHICTERDCQPVQRIEESNAEKNYKKSCLFCIHSKVETPTSFSGHIRQAICSIKQHEVGLFFDVCDQYNQRKEVFK